MTVPNGSRQILLHAMPLVMVGLAFGFVVPAAPHPQLALGARLECFLNGMTIIALATFLLARAHEVGPGSIRLMMVSACLTRGMAISELANDS